MNLLKKFLSVVLSVSMVFGMLTVTALGVVPEGEGVSNEAELYAAWKAGGTYYF